MKYAIISVWDKTGVSELAQALVARGYHILSTGGTYKILQETVGDHLTQVSDFTGSPEVLGGRVKTLHPTIHAGILARDDQLGELEDNGLSKIGVVVANLYPFVDTVKSGADEDTVLENIDIGGHTLIRAAAKNYKNTLIITDPKDYQQVINSMEFDYQASPAGAQPRNREFAAKAFAHAAEYDIAISQYFGDNTVRKYYPIRELKYGCNPHQQYAALCGFGGDNVPIKVLNGNIGYINLIDALLGFKLVCEAAGSLGYPVSASYKHTSPAGVGMGIELTDKEKIVFGVPEGLSDVAIAFIRARNCDPLSSFGDFISISHTVDTSCAQMIKREVSDGVIAPGYTPEALEILRTKKNGNYTIVQLASEWCEQHSTVEYREICGMALCQSMNTAQTTVDDLSERPTIAKDIPEPRMQDLILANITLKYTQSNSIAYAYGGQVIGIGAGQQNRVDCVKLAGRKSQRWGDRFTDSCIEYMFSLSGSRSEKNNKLYEYLDTHCGDDIEELCLASDAFFPFPDSIHTAEGYGVKYILQPGGSMGDAECIKACDKYGMVMAMSGKRMFLH